jgi:hypothetical protein
MASLLDFRSRDSNRYSTGIANSLLLSAVLSSAAEATVGTDVIQHSPATADARDSRREIVGPCTFGVVKDHDCTGA